MTSKKILLIVLLIHQNIFYPPFLSYSLLSCCYTHHPPLSFYLTFFFVFIIVSCYFDGLFYCRFFTYFTVRLAGGLFSERADGREKILTANCARFCCVVELVSKGLSSDHAQIVLKLVPVLII